MIAKTLTWFCQRADQSFIDSITELELEAAEEEKTETNWETARAGVQNAILNNEG